MNKLVVCIMGQDCERFIGMCLESVKDADTIIYCDGGSTEDFWSYFVSITNDKDIKVINNEYNQQDKQMNGKQRNFYLNYLKRNYPDDWCLCLDADEVVDDLNKIKEFIQTAKHGLYSPKMRHLIQDLAHEDATSETHNVLNRLFKISEVNNYTEVEHSVLQPKKQEFILHCNVTTIWHLAYIPNLWEIKKRYDNHMKKSNMHTPEFLKDWYFAHLFGTYPKRLICLDDLPKTILNNFGIDKEELYFKNRRDLDRKHFLDAIYLKEWINSKVNNPNIIYFGCGMGMRVWVSNKIGLKAHGNELSSYAVKESFCPEFVKQGDLTTGLSKIDNSKYDITIAYDVLEHLKYEDLNKAIDSLITNTNKYILLSIPYKGTPNCEADSTHIIKEDRHWWVNQFTKKKLKEVKVPSHWLFNEQLLIFEK